MQHGASNGRKTPLKKCSKCGSKKKKHCYTDVTLCDDLRMCRVCIVKAREEKRLAEADWNDFKMAPKHLRLCRGLSNVDHVVVEGCEISEVNGTYIRVNGLVYRGNSVYTKLGHWDVNTSTATPNFVIYREILSNNNSYWYIGRLYSEVTSTNIGRSFTLCTSRCNDVTPPKAGWDNWTPESLQGRMYKYNNYPYTFSPVKGNDNANNIKREESI